MHVTFCHWHQGYEMHRVISANELFVYYNFMWFKECDLHKWNLHYLCSLIQWEISISIHVVSILFIGWILVSLQGVPKGCLASLDQQNYYKILLIQQSSQRGDYHHINTRIMTYRSVWKCLYNQTEERTVKYNPGPDPIWLLSYFVNAELKLCS